MQTERRLAALKADLAKVEQSKVEQKFGKKYHMVKFFGENDHQVWKSSQLTPRRAQETHPDHQANQDRARRYGG